MPGKRGVARLQSVSPDYLRELAKRLRRAAAEFNGLAEVIDELDEKKVAAEGVSSVDAAFEALNKFAGNVRKKTGGF